MEAKNSATADDLQLFIQELEELEDLATKVVEAYLNKGDCSDFKAALEALAIFLKIM
ncbi:MAG: hypothetical protein HXY43_21375 [Fischerella sp.]|uniref:hypothetical protein n=1 Tax=Fischerella sp. TaxID=1191 RepID=UPI0018581F2F|nr:hypothetical protein [Fischerella sp.]NWF61734.1 hypothetical protein [Fischerella sp.]